MAELNKIRFLLSVALMIFPAHALDVIFSGAHQDFKQKSEIKTNITNGAKVYAGTLNPLTYEAGVNISNVIVYIIDKSRYVEIIRNAVRGTRLQIADELKEWNYELVFLGIDNFDDDEHHLIGGFILENIQPHQDQIDQELTIKVIGENRFDRSYECLFAVFERYQENAQICGGTLSARLSAIRHGALRPVESNDGKFIKLLAYLSPKYSTENEMTWSVRVEGDTYVPGVDVNAPEYNFRIRHPNEKICVIILDGYEYSVVTNLRTYSPERTQMRKIQKKMEKNDEVLYIMGVYNFDWYDVYLVTHIILKHTQGLQNSSYNVFAGGFGMFDTYYLNWYEIDGRYIQQIQNLNVSNIVKALPGQEVKEKAIKMHYFDNGWRYLEIPISLGNGQYIALGRFASFTFPWLSQRIAFFVYDSADANDPIDYPTAHHFAEELRRSDIFVVVLEAINFKLYDIHIIAEWIEKHKAQINPEQIAVLGAGIFDTIFQSQSTTFKAFFNIGKNELKTIRNAYVERGNDKRVLAAKIDDSNANFETWSYPINTVVNGVYETDLIPDKNVFDTSDNKKILFIITSPFNFRQIAAIQNVGTVAAAFRRNIHEFYPIWEWSIFLVAFDNFGEGDSHLFAELVKMQTHDERPLAGFVCVATYGIKCSAYRYKNTAPLTIDFYGGIRLPFTFFFGRECILLDETRFDC